MAIILRGLDERDLEKVMRWRMKPEITRYMYTDPDLNMKKQKKWFRKVSSDDSYRYWVIQVDNVDIGVMYLTNIDFENRKCSWGYYIANDSFRGRGLARALEYSLYEYVFEEMNFNKLWCEVLKQNEKVIKIHQKYGSEIEGELKQHIYKNGEFHDVVRMAITKDKWDRIKNNSEYEEAQFQ